MTTKIKELYSRLYVYSRSDGTWNHLKVSWPSLIERFTIIPQHFHTQKNNSQYNLLTFQGSFWKKNYIALVGHFHGFSITVEGNVAVCCQINWLLVGVEASLSWTWSRIVCIDERLLSYFILFHFISALTNSARRSPRIISISPWPMHERPCLIRTVRCTPCLCVFLKAHIKEERLSVKVY